MFKWFVLKVCCTKDHCFCEINSKFLCLCFGKKMKKIISKEKYSERKMKRKYKKKVRASRSNVKNIFHKQW